MKRKSKYELIESDAFPIFTGTFEEFQKQINEKSLVFYFSPDCYKCHDILAELEGNQEFKDLTSKLRIQHRIGINALEPNDDHFKEHLNYLFPKPDFPMFYLYGPNIRSEPWRLYGRNKEQFFGFIEKLHSRTFQEEIKLAQQGTVGRLVSRLGQALR